MSLSDPARPDQVRHYDMGGASLQYFSIGVPGEQSFTNAMGYAGFRSQARQISWTIRLDHVFHPEYVIRFQGPSYPHSAVEIPARMPFNENIDLVPNGVSNFLNTL